MGVHCINQWEQFAFMWVSILTWVFWRRNFHAFLNILLRPSRSILYNMPHERYWNVWRQSLYLFHLTKYLKFLEAIFLSHHFNFPSWPFSVYICSFWRLDPQITTDYYHQGLIRPDDKGTSIFLFTVSRFTFMKSNWCLRNMNPFWSCPHHPLVSQITG